MAGSGLGGLGAWGCGGGEVALVHACFCMMKYILNFVEFRHVYSVLLLTEFMLVAVLILRSLLKRSSCEFQPLFMLYVACMD